MTKPIQILERFRPFSHQVGTNVPIPRTSYYLEAFPTLMRLKKLGDQSSSVSSVEISFDIQGPVKQFTVELDLKKERIKVWGETKEGWLRYVIEAKENGIQISFEKQPCHLKFTLDTSITCLRSDKTLFFEIATFPSTHKEILSLGSNKQLNWDKVKTRLNLTEIFPCLFLFGQMFGKSNKVNDIELLNKCLKTINCRPEYILEPFLEFFLVHFNGMLNPQLKDLLFQGIIQDKNLKNENEYSILSLLVNAYYAIRHLFIDQIDNTIKILPHLPPEFFCGRMIDVNCQSLGILHLEWTKKKVRRLNFFSNSKQELLFLFPSSIKKFRFRTHLKEKGQFLASGTPLVLESSQLYYLDRFEQ